MQTRVKSGIFKPKAYNIIVSSPIEVKLQTIFAILQSHVWKHAMNEEFQALQKNNT